MNRNKIIDILTLISIVLLSIGLIVCCKVNTFIPVMFIVLYILISLVND